MVKARVGVRIKDAVSGGKSHNRSADMDQLMGRFTAQKKKIEVLTNVLRKHHALMLAMNESRVKVSFCMGLLDMLHGRENGMHQ